MAVVATPSPSGAGLPADPTLRRFRGSAKIADYDILNQKLGEGTFGVVSKARSKRTGAVVALKKILMHNEKDGFPITALREVKLLKMLSHPNILRLEEMAVERQPQDEKGKSGKKRATLYMVTPYMDHDLSGMLTNPDIQLFEAQIKCYLLQLLEGLRYLHDSHILHRDMKAANILISNKGILQIADFGLARHYDGPPPQPGYGNGEAVRDYTSLVVTRWYRPPELLLTLRRYTPAIDMWGVGCVFAEMFERKPILEGRTDIDQCVKIFELVGSPTDSSMPGWNELPGCDGRNTWDQKRGNIDSRFGRYLPPQGLDLLKRLMCLDWRKRINAIDALKHPYFTTAPQPARPEDLPRYADSHELDARRRGQQESRNNLPPAPKGGTVGMGPDEHNGGYYQNGYPDRPPPGYGRDRGPPRGRYDDRGPPPVTGGGRRPGYQQDRDRGAPAPRAPPNGNGVPPPRHELPPRPDVPARGGPPPRAVPRENVDTYIPSYSGPDRRDRDRDRDRPPPRDDYGRDRRSSRDRAYRDPDAPGGGRGGGVGRDYRDRDRDRDYHDRPPRARSRSPDRRSDDNARRERLRDREREMYRQ